VRVLGSANQRYAVLFRDYLRAHPSTADAYARVKTALAHYHANDIDAYYAVKDPACDLIMGGAEDWAVTTQWVQGASDC
ncbi:MAG TPA: GrpB family protein, partial [Anaerolineae bacterium]